MIRGDSDSEDDYIMSDISESTHLVPKARDEARKKRAEPARSGSVPVSQAPATVKRKPQDDFDNISSIGSSDGMDDNWNRDDTVRMTSPGSVSSDERKSPTDKQEITGYVFVLSTFAAIGGFLFGYDTGVVSGAMLLLKDEFGLSSLLQEVIVSVTIGVAFVGALCGGFLSDKFGRRVCTILASLVFTAGAVVLGVAQNVEMLIAGRATLGLGIGLASMTVPVYIAEIAPAHLRGRLLTVNTLFITGGQFVASVLDGAFSYLEHDGWRYMLGLAGVPSAIQLIGFIFLPESPRWLMKHGDEDSARSVLQKIRGTKEVEDELEDIRATCEEDKKSRQGGTPTLLLMLKSPNMRRALIVGCGLQLFQQISGINTVMYYSASIIKMAGVRDQHTAIWLAAMTAGINFVFTLVGVWLVERIGRKPLILGSLLGVILSLVVLAVGFQLAAFNSPPITYTQSLDNSSCRAYSSCEGCIDNNACGFCYTEVNSKAYNGSCIASDSADDNANSLYGRCSSSANMTQDSVIWAYDYCPTSYSWIAVLGLSLYLMFFAPGMGPMPWTINAEIYPLWARSTGNSMSAATNWISNLVVSMTFLTLTETITKYGTYWLFVGVAVIGFAFFILLLPETKGRKLEDVEELFSKPWCWGGGDGARFSAAVQPVSYD